MERIIANSERTLFGIACGLPEEIVMRGDSLSYIRLSGPIAAVVMWAIIRRWPVADCWELGAVGLTLGFKTLALIWLRSFRLVLRSDSLSFREPLRRALPFGLRTSSP